MLSRLDSPEMKESIAVDMYQRAYGDIFGKDAWGQIEKRDEQHEKGMWRCRAKVAVQTIKKHIGGE